MGKTFIKNRAFMIIKSSILPVIILLNHFVYYRLSMLSYIYSMIAFIMFYVVLELKILKRLRQFIDNIVFNLFLLVTSCLFLLLKIPVLRNKVYNSEYRIIRYLLYLIEKKQNNLSIVLSIYMYLTIILMSLFKAEFTGYYYVWLIIGIYYILHLFLFILDFFLDRINTVVSEEKIKAIYVIGSIILILVAISTFYIKVNGHNFRQDIYILLFLLTLMFLLLSVTTFITSLSSKYVVNLKSISSVLVLLLIITILNISCLYLGNVLIYLGNNDAFTALSNSPFHSLLYYTIISVTAVGYGDITPNSVLSRNWSIASALFGFVILTTFISSIASYNVNQFSLRSKRPKRNGKIK
ncbi:potassium channel family protein [Haloplasma contractile]|uniref:Voltage-gated potassium channel protein n=1 Tax=Haloplasma contractile SSD-17B TaxID=1033810 RepID=F7Q1W9_9MOLU|nr:potassium channel family protein [Haloplasma contractile]ERJ12219.1 Putative voltage-gated potassium channel protein [Haloplasma contractile SSD-17B]